MEITKKSQFVVLPADTDPVQEKYNAWQTLRDNGMTIMQVAKLFGVAYETIRNHTETHYDWRGGNTTSHDRAERRKEYYVPIMENLRSHGYNNSDIARITGFSKTTVFVYIGNQPDEISLASYRTAGAKRRFRNLAVKNQPCRDANEPIPAVAEVLKTA